MGYIYIIYLREFLQSKQLVFKIGRTRDIVLRFSQYPKGSILLFCCYVENEVSMENHVKENLSAKFVRRTDYGHEFFEGEFVAIRSCVMSCITEFDTRSMVEEFGPIVVYEPIPKVNRTDPTIAVSNFYEEKSMELIGQTFKTTDLFTTFSNWLHTNKISTNVNFRIFTSILQDVYGATTQLKTFENGQCMAITFSQRILERDNVMKTFVDEAIEKTGDKKDYITLNDVYETYVKIMKRDAMRKNAFEEEIQLVLGPYIKKRKFARKFWQGMRIRMDGITFEEDENENSDSPNEL